MGFNLLEDEVIKLKIYIAPTKRFIASFTIKLLSQEWKVTNAENGGSIKPKVKSLYLNK